MGSGEGRVEEGESPELAVSLPLLPLRGDLCARKAWDPSTPGVLLCNIPIQGPGGRTASAVHTRKQGYPQATVPF